VWDFYRQVDFGSVTTGARAGGIWLKNRAVGVEPHFHVFDFGESNQLRHFGIEHGLVAILATELRGLDPSFVDELVSEILRHEVEVALILELPAASVAVGADWV
jgi:hypothetical protein